MSITWKLSDLNQVPKNGKKVFSAFHCGGGSTMGYKLAGYNVLGGIEINPEMMKIYRENHKPTHSFLMGVQEFKKRSKSEIHKDLFNLDILDGSPPCSSFSMAGAREKNWGKEKKFREGQASQVLDDLFFDFIDIAKMLQPKVVIAENVKGLIIGNARGYVKLIGEAFDKAGYETQLFLLNAAFMGVPQRRERTFFIARRKDLNYSDIKLEFNEPTIPFSRIDDGDVEITKPLTGIAEKYWTQCKPGYPFSSVHPKKSCFGQIKVAANSPLVTITSAGQMYHHTYPRTLTTNEIIKGQTFPLDYNFLDLPIKYVCGMSVPPFMMRAIASEIYKQWLKPKHILKKRALHADKQAYAT